MSHGGARRPKGLTPKTRAMLERMERRLRLEPDVPIKETAKLIGWSYTAFKAAKRKLELERGECKVDSFPLEKQKFSGDCGSQ